MTFRCKRSEFTAEQYKKYERSFWAMPARWGIPGESRLAKLWYEGRAGAISILPVLGQFGNAEFSDELWLSYEEIARLAGVTPKTVSEAARVLSDLGLATAQTGGRWNGRRAAQWKLGSRLAVPKESAPDDGTYFYFPARFLYGGNWARLTPVQRALYLAVGAQARKFDQHPENNPLLRAALAPHVESFDFERCRDYVCRQRDPHARGGAGWLRLACLSFHQISQITGIAESALYRAVAGVKHPDNWRGIVADLEALKHCPLAVYPTDGGSLLYHLRDHAPAWPFDTLNESLKKKRRRPKVAEWEAEEPQWIDDSLVMD